MWLLASMDKPLVPVYFSGRYLWQLTVAGGPSWGLAGGGGGFAYSDRLTPPKRNRVV